MKRKKGVLSDDVRDTPWSWVGGEQGEAWANQATALLTGAWKRSVKQARSEGFNKDDAKDLASDVRLFLMKRLVKDTALLDRPKEFEKRRRYITKTRIYNWRRGGRRADRANAAWLEFLEQILPEWMFADRRVEHITPDNRLREALSKLPPNLRLAVFLRYGHDLMPGEIATATATPVSTIKGRIHRGFKELCQLMSARPTDPMETPS